MINQFSKITLFATNIFFFKIKNAILIEIINFYKNKYLETGKFSKKRKVYYQKHVECLIFDICDFCETQVSTLGRGVVLVLRVFLTVFQVDILEWIQMPKLKMNIGKV